MSRFSGVQGKGAQKRAKEQRRIDAEARDAALPADSPKRAKIRRAQGAL